MNYLEEARRIFNERGSELLSTEYKNSLTPLKFRCTKCGGTGTITWKKLRVGQNQQCLCEVCFKQWKKGMLREKQKINFNSVSIEEVSKAFQEKGAVLLSKEFINIHEPLEFLCSYCGRSHKISWSSFKNGRNPNLLCGDCLKGLSLNPQTPYGSGNRHLIDNFWFNIIKEYFNIPQELKNKVSAHHIKAWRNFPEYRTSISNGYPLWTELHKQSAILNGVKNPFHSIKGYKEIQQYPEEAKLLYHTYKSFEFLDLNSAMITEIIAPTEDTPTNKFLQKKKDFAEKGILYIPISFEELFISQKAQIIYSMIRARLWKKFPDIYKYTGQHFSKYQARTLQFGELSSHEATQFFNENHIQGMVGGIYYFGLKTTEGELVAAMSFGKARFNKQYPWELLRYCCKINSFVAGGAQKLFKHAVEIMKPTGIVSYCDLRFSSINPEETFYIKLGFNYLGISKPNYRYIDPETNRSYSRMQFQKHKLEAKLKNFDASLSEAENMRNNGFVRQYDCGNLIFGITFDNNI